LVYLIVVVEIVWRNELYCDGGWWTF